jgi:hypothetical protein
VDVVPHRVRPTTHQRLQFAWHGCDDGDSGHEADGAYPCAWNHSIAARMAG